MIIYHQLKQKVIEFSSPNDDSNGLVWFDGITLLFIRQNQFDKLPSMSKKTAVSPWFRYEIFLIIYCRYRFT